MRELKPCPFCGGKDIASYDVSDYNMDSSPEWNVYCNDCGGEYKDIDKDKAEDGWNMREKDI